MLKGLLVSLTTFCLIFLCAEILLRFLTVRNNDDWMAVDDVNPILRHFPNEIVTWSEGWWLGSPVERRSNNEGFLNDQDYITEGKRPIISIIGDSYVQAMMVTYEETLYGRLAHRLSGTGRVYTFGISSAPASQYLAWATHARKKYDVDALIFTVVGNDFNESFYRNKKSGGLHYFSEQGELVRYDLKPSFLRTIVLTPALGRYLFYHLRVGHLPLFLQQLSPIEIEYFGNMPYQLSEAEERDSIKAIDFFFDALPEQSGLPPNKITFVLDALRPNIYNPHTMQQAEKSYWGRMRRRFTSVAKANGYEVIDMNPVFVEHFQQNGKRFEFETDGHWNSLGHQLVFEELMKSRLLNQLLHKKTEY